MIHSFKYILDFYFGDIPLSSILNLSAASLDEFGPSDILDVSSETGLITTVENTQAGNIAHYQLPCILFCKQQQACVLLEHDSKEAIIYDAKNKEEKKVPVSKLNKEFDTAIFFSQAQGKDETHEKKKSNSWFWKPIIASWRAYAEVAILTLFINIFALAIPLFIMNVYDRVVPNFAKETLIVLSCGVLIILVFDIIFKSIRVYILESTGKKLGNYYEEELMRRVLCVQGRHDTLPTGTKANLFRELNQVKDFFTSRSINCILDIPFFIISILIIFLISPTLSLIPLLSGLFIIVLNIIAQFPIAALTKDSFKDIQAKSGYLIESIRGREAIKLSNATPKKIFNWRNIIAFSGYLGQKIRLLNNLVTILSGSIIQMVTIAVVFVGVHEIHNNNLSIGALIAVTILSSRSMVPIVSLANILIRFKEVKSSLDSVNKYWNLPLESNKKIEAGIETLQGKIEFNNVEFFYKDAKLPTLQACSFVIEAGEKVGIIGQTGAGKSTINRLIAGLDSPTDGNIYLDGYDITTIHPSDIRQNIGIMPQEPFLFDGTIKENISLSRPIDKKRLHELIELTGLDTLIKKSGEGEMLKVGEGGGFLSVGQRHLLSLARALVNDPPILVLDEPTTGLDITLERQLIKRLQGISKTKTLVLITHRFAALDLVDRVIVINQGTVVADGPKDKVLNMLQGQG